MSIKMLHTCIRVMDLEKSLEFYKNALGLVETRRKDFPEHKFTLVYLSDVPGKSDQAAQRDCGTSVRCHPFGYAFIPVADLYADGRSNCTDAGKDRADRRCGVCERDV